MKNGKVIKSAAEDNLAGEMALVNACARRELTPDEVYLFTVALCDNDIDRDNERFTVEALFALEKLFVGKTGIIDHDPTAKNQKARIISCRVESVEGKTTALGDQLFRLTARAYIRRTEGNRELIEAIESGIVKEVSVGCSVEKTVCSVCRNDMRSPLCNHIKGREYNGEKCYGELCEPTDAYEFSFVAIPAQRAAGVIKSGIKEKKMDKFRRIKSMLESEKDVHLSQGDLEALREYIGELKKNADCAEAYRAELCTKLREKIAGLSVRLDYNTSKSIIDKLDVAELQALNQALEREPRVLAAPQLCSAPAAGADGNTEFRI